MRLYICHTFYHVYISVLKEMVFQKQGSAPGDILLSTMSTDFGRLNERLEKSGLFRRVAFLPECHPRFFPKPFPGDLGKGNPVYKLLQRRRFYRYMVENEEPYLQWNYRDYEDIYVFCDSDPIGYYLNAKRIPYISVEDGSNSGRYNSVVNANESLFHLKRLLAKLNYLFMQDGYGCYCRGYEVNSADGVIATGRRIIENPTAALIAQLSDSDSERLYRIFRSWESLPQSDGTEHIMVLTQPLCTEEMRVKMYRELIRRCADGCEVIIKPHPIDKVDYQREFPDCLVLPGSFPVEILNIYCEYNIRKVVTVYSTSMDNLRFAREKESLGLDFLDLFEDSALHADLRKYEVKK